MPRSGISWAQIREMPDRCHEISNHTWTHSRLTGMSDDEVRAELKTADDTIEAHTGKRPLTVAVPFNDLDERIRGMVRQDHPSGFRSVRRPVYGEVIKKKKLPIFALTF